MPSKLKGQLFARLALDYFDHPKIVALSDAAIVAHLQMIVYCRKYQTDGNVPMRVAMRFACDDLCELESNDPERPSIVRHEDGSLYLHDYADFQETRDDVQKRRRSAKDAATARWSDDAKGNASRIPKGNADRSAFSNAETETETETYKTRTREFDDWWSHWKKKVKRGDAETAFKTARSKASLEELIAGADRYFTWVHRNSIEDQYVTGPGPWLRQQRWADELTDRNQQPNTGTSPTIWDEVR